MARVVGFEILSSTSGPGTFLRAYIELPDGLNSIDLSTVQLHGFGLHLKAHQDEVGLPDCDNDGQPDRFCDWDGDGRRELVVVFGPLAEPLKGKSKESLMFRITGRMEEGTGWATRWFLADGLARP